jgi:hypothetical protein
MPLIFAWFMFISSYIGQQSYQSNTNTLVFIFEWTLTSLVSGHFLTKARAKMYFALFYNGKYYGTILAITKKVNDNRPLPSVASDTYVACSSDVGLYCSFLPTYEISSTLYTIALCTYFAWPDVLSLVGTSFGRGVGFIEQYVVLAVYSFLIDLFIHLFLGWKPSCCPVKNLKKFVLVKYHPKRDAVTGEWEKLYNETLNDRY